jgi:hypothetical protein
MSAETVTSKSVSSAVEGVAKESGCAVERNAAAFEVGDVELEDVMHAFEDLELDRNAGLRRAIGILLGVIEQAFVSAHLNEERRQVPQIAEEG